MASRPRVTTGTGPGPVAAALFSLATLVGVWQVVSFFTDPRLFPPPAAVLAATVREIASGELPFHLGVTLLRVIAAFVIAMLIGAVAGIYLGLHSAANRFFDPWVVLLLNAPALVIIVLAYIWFGLNETAAIGAVALSKIPNIIVTMREGARALDPVYSELATVYRFSRMDRLIHVTLPQLHPFLAAAARSGISLIWKIVLVVELLGRSNGVGFQIHLYFQMFDVAAILAYTISFVAVMLAVELIALQPYERAATKWRIGHA